MEGVVLLTSPMSASDLADFPPIQAAYESLTPQPVLEDTHIGLLVADFAEAPWNPVVPALNDALARLHARFGWEQLVDALGKLFSSEQAKERFFDGAAEVHALAYIDECGALEHVGWPLNWPSDTPPFEGTISTDGTEATRVAFDVKSGFRSGQKTLRDRLQEVVDSWACGRGLPRVLVGLLRGSPLLHEAGPVMTALQRQLEAELSRHDSVPREPVVLRAGNAELPVTLTEALASTRVFEGLRPMDDRGWGETVRDHVVGKSKRAADCPPPIPFLLMYVRPPGRGAGAELHDIVFAQAWAYAVERLQDGPSPAAYLWLGALLLYWKPDGGPKAFAALNDDRASWPPSLAAPRLARVLKAEDVTGWECARVRPGPGE
jgi:hypothetical protein